MTERSRTRAKIKLLVVSQYFYPEQFRINDICAEWVKREYDVTVVTGIPNYPQGRFYSGYGRFRKRRETHDGVKIIRLPIISRGNSTIRLGMNYLSFVVSGFFWQALTRQRSDLVFSFEVSPMTQVLPAVWFARRRKVPCFAYIQDLWPGNFQEMTGIANPMVIGLITKMTMYIYKHCSMIFVPSKSFHKAIAGQGIHEDKLVYWPQYAEDFYKLSKTASPLIPPDSRLTIAFTGNIGTSQGLEILPKTASLLRMKGYRVRFILVGDGRGMSNLKKAIAERGVEDYFLFIPQQPPEVIPSILASADAAFISFADKPLFTMTLPAKLQSYMACGIPIIAAAGGEIKGVVNEAMCGLCSPAGDVDALKRVIEIFADLSIDDRHVMAQRGLEYARKWYSKDALLDEMDAYLIEWRGTDVFSINGENKDSVTDPGANHG